MSRIVSGESTVVEIPKGVFVGNSPDFVDQAVDLRIAVEVATIESIRAQVYEPLVLNPGEVQGQCIWCEQNIGAKRLEAMPNAKKCIICETLARRGMNPDDENFEDLYMEELERRAQNRAQNRILVETAKKGRGKRAKTRTRGH